MVVSEFSQEERENVEGVKGKVRRTVKSSSRQGTKVALSTKAMPPSVMTEGKLDRRRVWKRRVRVHLPSVQMLGESSVSEGMGRERERGKKEKGIKKGGGRRDNYPVQYSSASGHNEKRTHRMCHTEAD